VALLGAIGGQALRGLQNDRGDYPRPDFHLDPVRAGAQPGAQPKERVLSPSANPRTEMVAVPIRSQRRAEVHGDEPGSIQKEKTAEESP